MDAIIAEQDGRCPICLRLFSSSLKPNVDHDHKAGTVRGALCTYDNRYRVGRERDPAPVYRTAEYLDDPPALRAIGERVVPPTKPKRRSTKRKGTSTGS